MAGIVRLSLVMLRLRVASSLAASALLLPSLASAFAYPEHMEMTAAALAQVLADRPDARVYFRSLEAFTVPTHLCSGDGLFDADHHRGCFAVADLPSLGADHAISPEGLFVRWILADDAAQSAALTALGRPPAEDPDFEVLRDPAVCGQSAPDVPAMMAALRHHDLHGAYADLGFIDLRLSSADPNYVCLALRAQGHFRLPGLPAAEAVGRSTANAADGYARFHQDALALAWMGAHDAPNAAQWRALSVLVEGFALHYLEDAVAAGHMVASAATMPVENVRSTHDHYNDRGLEVSLPMALCAEAHDARRTPRLARLCAGERRGVERGDYALARGTDRSDANDVTREVATAVTAASLRELLDPLPELPTTCAEALLRCARENEGDVARVLRCAPVHALEGCAGELRVAAPLRMLPEPARPVAVRGIFGGGAWTVGLTTRLALDVSTSPVGTASVTTVSVGRAAYSPVINGHQLGLGAELMASMAYERNAAQALPSLPGMRLWATWSFDGAGSGRSVYSGLGLMVEGMQRAPVGGPWVAGVGLGAELIALGVTVETTERTAVRAQVVIDGTLPLFDAPAGLLAGLGLSATLH